jgi:hypothetical protein
MKLWKEYAVEPTLFSDYHLGCEILSGVGIENGRVIGALPRKWEREVRRATVGQREIQRKRIEERLLALRTAIVPRTFEWNGGRSWREQVLEAHAEKPFDGLLLNGAVNDPAAIDATLGLQDGPCWESSRRLEVPRNGSALAGALAYLLRQAREVLLVDAYFNPSTQLDQSKWLKPLHAIARALPKDGRLTRFEVHTLDSRVPRLQWAPGTFVNHCRSNLPSAVPGDLTVKAVLWSERDGGLQFHERLIFTDIGGVVVDPGIDEGGAGETYVLRLLSKSEIPAYFAKFDPATSPYNVVDEVAIRGA